MSKPSWVGLIVIGGIIGFMLYPVINPMPEFEVPEPEFKEGVAETLYVDRVIRDTVKLTPGKDTVYINDEPKIYDVVDTTIALFDADVEIQVRARAVELDFLEVIGLKMIERVIVRVDTLTNYVPYPVEIPRSWYNSGTAWFIYGIIATLTGIWALSKLQGD